MKKQKKEVNWEFRAIGELLDQESAKEVFDAEQFQCHILWPSGWRSKAHLMMRAALKLLQKCADANERTVKRDDEDFKRRMSGEQVPGSRTLEGQELEDHYDFLSGPIGLLLAGYAIENQLKGIIFSQSPELLSENLELDRRFTHHELDKLYRDAGFASSLEEMDDETRKILNWLTQIVVWQGRYMVPLNFEDFIDKKPAPGREGTDKLIALYIKLDDKLSQISIPPTHMSKRCSGQ